MKTIRCVLLAIGIAACLAQADDIKPQADAAAPAVGGAKSNALTPEDRAQYANLIRREIESSTQLKLLTELADEHLKRSTESHQSGPVEKTKWEADLAQEFRARSAVVLGQLNDFTRQRLAFEASHGTLPAPASVLGVLEDAKSLTPDQLAYIEMLDESLLKVRQELALVNEAAKTLSSELLTNTTPEAVGRISDLLDFNARQARQWEREQTDFELRKLEFRAMRK